MSFKIIAINPLKGCETNFRKNLEEDTVYKLYNHFDIKITNNDYTKYDNYIIKFNLLNYPDFLYNVGDLNIQISAIVGENGSGKSTISELISASLYVVALNLDMIKVNDFIYKVDDKNLSEDEQNQKLKKEKDNYEISIGEIETGLKVDIIYEIDSKIYILRVLNGKVVLLIYQDDKCKETLISADFYTIVTNYSHYSFNQNFDKKYWIKGIFHKNDGYQTPIVINPYRKNGNIDINNESTLTRARLLSNILSIDNYDDINPKSRIEYIIIKPNLNKINKLISQKNINSLLHFRNEFIEPLFRKKFSKDYVVRGRDDISSIFKILEIYLVEKLKTLTKRYNPYYKFKGFEQDANLRNDYFNYLIDDKSHITLKVNQVLNYLNENIYFDNEELITKPVAIDLEKSRKFLNIKRSEIAEFLVPSIFDSEIFFKDKSTFENLSSGEKQKIYSLNSIIYHLRNIDSVHNIQSDNYIKYFNVNLIMDEIELYYHPKIQKSTINDFLELIGSVNFKNLKNLNLIFLTHSPLILSDIISNNILYLNKIKNNSKRVSFAANIFNLYADSFFIGDNLIGDFAKKKINETIEWINKLLNNKRNNKKLVYSVKEQKEYKEIIDIIDEPIIKTKLLEMYSEIFGNEERKKNIEYEIERLNNELKALQ
ncbi:ATP-binding protein [Flavobacterium psychrophilum]|nr:ATP-binding protein [Flavobacterium psychrophilum]EKT4510608.1 ATP-binding protein [Flavobacterium psychrophilum]